jgi:hypothetical protein
MGPAPYLRLSRVSSSFLSLTACLLCAAGCNNTCVSGTLNSPGGSTITVKSSSPPPSCTLSTANGIVRMEIGAASGAASAPGATRPYVAHLFVTLAGVDAHSSALAGDDAPGWQPLAPELQAHPIQVDLLADARANRSNAPLPDAVLPTGAYRQIRLRLASLPTAESALETNHCPGGESHCAVMSDGQILPLAFPPSRPDLRLMFPPTPGRELYVPPDGVVVLAIELDQDRSWVWPSGHSLLFNPVFRLDVQQPASLSDD